MKSLNQTKSPKTKQKSQFYLKSQSQQIKRKYSLKKSNPDQISQKSPKDWNFNLIILINETCFIPLAKKTHDKQKETAKTVSPFPHFPSNQTN